MTTEIHVGVGIRPGSRSKRPDPSAKGSGLSVLGIADIPTTEYNAFRKSKLGPGGIVWTILFDEEFADWLDDLSDAERNPILARAGLLREHGPNLGRPHVDTLKGSKVGNLKELRLQIQGNPWRVLFAFDPRQSAILLLGGCKQGDKRWYKVNIPLAEARYLRHLDRLKGGD